MRGSKVLNRMKEMVRENPDKFLGGRMNNASIVVLFFVGLIATIGGWVLLINTVGWIVASGVFFLLFGNEIRQALTREFRSRNGR